MGPVISTNSQIESMSVAYSLFQGTRSRFSPFLDFSEMNTFVRMPKTKMEHLEDMSRLLQEPYWAASRSSSVSLSLDKEGPRLVRIQFIFQIDFRVSS